MIFCQIEITDGVFFKKLEQLKLQAFALKFKHFFTELSITENGIVWWQWESLCPWFFRNAQLFKKNCGVRGLWENLGGFSVFVFYYFLRPSFLKYFKGVHTWDAPLPPPPCMHLWVFYMACKNGFHQIKINGRSFSFQIIKKFYQKNKKIFWSSPVQNVWSEHRNSKKALEWVISGQVRSALGEVRSGQIR